MAAFGAQPPSPASGGLSVYVNVEVFGLALTDIVAAGDAALRLTGIEAFAGLLRRRRAARR
jgi:hypothetical protein